jgi:hypothetical protein
VASRSATSLIDPRVAIDARDAGRRLGVATVLAGRVRRQAAQLRLTVELVDVATGVQLWSHTYEREGKDAFRVQDEIAHAIAAALSVELAGSARPAVANTESPEAHDLVLRARYQSNVAGEVGGALGHRCRTQLMYAEGQYDALMDTLRAEAVPSPWTHALLAAAFAGSGRKADARREADSVEAAGRERHIDERIPAGMYAAMGDHDRAIAWLERGFESNAAIIAYMNVDNRLAPLRSDPRFRAMVRRAGLR